MTSQAILTLLITISVISFLFSTVLEIINLKSLRTDIPEEVISFYDVEKYQKSIRYQQEKTRFGLLSESFSFLISITLLATGGFGWLDTLLRTWFVGEIPLALAFFGLVVLISDLLSLPFQWHDTFRIEEKYGFNKTTITTFMTDKIKGYAIGALVGGALLSCLIYLTQVLGPDFWIWFALIAASFLLFMNVFYTSIFLPLFNKLTPLAEGGLKTAIRKFADGVHFPLEQVFVMDGSKRSAKANAFFSGIGRKKKIVLYDTLIANHSTEELVAVLAHEVGHYKKKHIIWSYLISVLQVFFVLFVLSLMIFEENLSIALGGTQQAIHLNLLAFGILFSPLSGITGLLMSVLSRKNEFEADAYACETANGPALALALKRLSVDSLSNLYPHPIYVFFHYSHPPLLSRLSRIQSPG
jgi:STE24 endopeptidase